MYEVTIEGIAKLTEEVIKVEFRSEIISNSTVASKVVTTIVITGQISFDSDRLFMKESTKSIVAWSLLRPGYGDVYKNVKVVLTNTGEIRYELPYAFVVSYHEHFEDQNGTFKLIVKETNPEPLFIAPKTEYLISDNESIAFVNEVVLNNQQSIRGDSIEGKGAYNSDVSTDGVGFGKLKDKEINPSQKGIDIVKQHLSGDFSDPANDAMIARLENALASGQKLTGADAVFYLHEIYESTLMKGGMDYDSAHAATLLKYGNSPFAVYHPEVISAYPDRFNFNFARFWGIEID